MANPNWKPGISGNPNGNSKMRMLSDDLRKVLVQNPARLRKITETLVTMAEEGDLSAIQLVFDRLEGRAHQTIAIDQTVTEMSRDERIARILELGSKLRVVEHAPLASDDQRLPSLAGPSERRQ